MNGFPQALIQESSVLSPGWPDLPHQTVPLPAVVDMGHHICNVASSFQDTCCPLCTYLCTQEQQIMGRWFLNKHKRYHLLWLVCNFLFSISINFPVFPVLISSRLGSAGVAPSFRLLCNIPLHDHPPFYLSTSPRMETQDISNPALLDLHFPSLVISSIKMRCHRRLPASHKLGT